MAEGILWHDPSIAGHENQQYVFAFKQAGFNLVEHTEAATAARELRARPPTSRWVVITSGRNGQAFVQQIHDLACVVEVLVFCMNVKDHKVWAQQFSKISNVVDVAVRVKEIVTRLQRARTLAVVLGAIPQDDAAHIIAAQFGGREVEDNELKYVVESTDGKRNELKCVKAWLVVVNRIQSGVITDDMVLAELLKLVDAPQRMRFKADWSGPWMRDSCAGDPQQVPLTCLAHKMSLAYTSEYVFSPLNKRLANFHLVGEVMHYVGAFIQELKAQSSLQHAGTEVLYRGIPAQYVQDADYTTGKTLLFPPFMSSSTEESKAEEFCLITAGDSYILRIKRLVNGHPGRHPTLDFNLPMTASWGHFGAREGEVLWLPFSSFLVTGREQRPVASPFGGTNTLTVVDVEELDSIYNVTREEVQNIMAEWLQDMKRTTERTLHATRVDWRPVMEAIRRYLDPESGAEKTLVKDLIWAATLPEGFEGPVETLRGAVAERYAEFILEFLQGRMEAVMSPQLQRLLSSRFEPLRHDLKGVFVNYTAYLWDDESFRVRPIPGDAIMRAVHRWRRSDYGEAPERAVGIMDKEILSGSWPHCVSSLVNEIRAIFKSEFVGEADPIDEDVRVISEALGREVDEAAVRRALEACGGDRDTALLILMDGLAGGPG